MLTSLGLTAEQQARYEYLISREPVTRDELVAARGEVSVSTMDGLEALGLVVRWRDRFAVVAPDATLDAMYFARASAPANLRRHLMTVATRNHDPSVRRKHGDQIEVVTGDRAMVRVYPAVQRAAKSEIAGDQCDRDAAELLTRDTTGVRLALGVGIVLGVGVAAGLLGGAAAGPAGRGDGRPMTTLAARRPRRKINTRP